MPAVAAAVATAFTAVVGVFTGATTVATAISAVTAIGSATIGAGITVSTAYNAISAISTIYALTRKPKIDPGGQQLEFRADPNAPSPFIIGRAATSGNVVFGTTHGDSNNFLTYGVVVSAAGPIQEYEQFQADDEAVTFGGSLGQLAQGKYIDKMWQSRFLGGIQATALSITQNDNKWSPIRWNPLLSNWWTAAHKLSGKAHYLWTMHVDPKLYGGVPKPTMVCKGIKVYDRRKDSSVGGSGAHRLNDPSTWEYSENPYAHASTYLYGYFEYSEAGQWVRVGGCGMAENTIDWASFVTGMNVADANGWKVSGVINTGMNKWSVLTAMLQAGGGVPIHRGALISCMTLAPRVSIATIEQSDLIGQAVIDAGALKRDRFNTGIPRIRSEPNGWQVTALPEKTSATYVAEDGRRVAKEVNFDMVAGGAAAATQAGQLTAYAVAENREGLQVTMTVGPKFADVRAGSAITLNMPTYGLNNQKMVVIRRRFDPKAFAYTFTVRTETDAKHAWALGQTTVAPASPSLNPNDGQSVPAPNATDWTVTAPNSTVTNLPVIRATLNPALTGTPTDRNATALIIDYRIVDGSNNPLTNWLSAEYPIAELIDHPAQANTRYQVKLRYRYPRGQQDPAVTTTPVYVTTSGVTSGSFDTTPPATPGAVTLSDLVSVNTDGTIVMQMVADWPDNAESDLSGYKVRWYEGGAILRETFCTNSRDTVNVRSGLAYECDVWAVDRTGNTSVGASFATRTAAADTTPPGTVVGLGLTALARRIVIAWQNPSDADYSHVELFRNTVNTTPTGATTPYVRRVEGSIYTDTNVSAGTTYHYWVRTFDRSGNGNASFQYLGSATPVFVSTGGGDVSPTDPTLVTSYGTAAFLNGEGALARQNSVTALQVPYANIANSFNDEDFNTTLIAVANGGAYDTTTETTTTLGAIRSIKSPDGAGKAAGAQNQFTTFGTPSLYVGVTAGKPFRFTGKALIKAGFTGLLRQFLYFVGPTGATVGGPTVLTYADCRAVAQASTVVVELDQQITVPAGAVKAYFVYIVDWSSVLTNAGYALVAKPGMRFVTDFAALASDAVRFGSNVRRADGTTMVTDATAITSLGTAAFIQNQAPWATSTISTNRLVYINDSGRMIDGRGLPLNAALGRGISFVPAWMFSENATNPDTKIDVAASVVTFAGGNTLSLPSATITGLTANTAYAVFRDIVNSVYVAVSGDSTSYRTSAAQYLYMGVQYTTDTGGGYTPLPPPPPGSGDIPAYVDPAV